MASPDPMAYIMCGPGPGMARQPLPAPLSPSCVENETSKRKRETREWLLYSG